MERFPVYFFLVIVNVSLSFSLKIYGKTLLITLHRNIFCQKREIENSKNVLLSQKGKYFSSVEGKFNILISSCLSMFSIVYFQE